MHCRVSGRWCEASPTLQGFLTFGCHQVYNSSTVSSLKRCYSMLLGRLRSSRPSHINLARGEERETAKLSMAKDGECNSGSTLLSYFKYIVLFEINQRTSKQVATEKLSLDLSFHWIVLQQAKNTRLMYCILPRFPAPSLDILQLFGCSLLTESEISSVDLCIDFYSRIWWDHFCALN